MNCIKCCAVFFVLISTLLVLSSASSHSKLQTAQRYENCVVRNLSELSIFDEEDRMRMDKLALETGVRMYKLELDPENDENARTMLRLFAAALANVVADTDSSNRHDREKACIMAFESCSEALLEKDGAELVKELRKIFSSMERVISLLDSAPDNKTPSASQKQEKHLEESTEHTCSTEEKEVKSRSKRAYVPLFGLPSSNVQFRSNLSLESIIADILLKSTSFNNYFKTGISQPDAIYYSRAMVGAGLAGYRYDLIDEALNLVTNEVTSLGEFAGPRDYAYAIARSIATVISNRNMFANGFDIGNASVFKLGSLSEPVSSFSVPSFGASASSSSWASAGGGQTGAFSFAQFNPSFIEPSFSTFNTQNSKDQFQNRMADLLSQSNIISEAFCSGSYPNLFILFNSALSGFGFLVSSTVANIASNSLSMLPTDAACTQYADVISEVITNVLQDNGLLETADAQEIVNNIEININYNPAERTENLGKQPFSGFSDFQLNPSFSDTPANFNPEYPAVENPDSSYVPSFQFDEPQFPFNPTEFKDANVQSQSGIDASTIEISDKQDFNIPATSGSDGIDSTIQSSTLLSDPKLSNTSIAVSGLLSNATKPLDKLNQTRVSLDVSSGVLLEPGPVILQDAPVGKSKPEEVNVKIEETPAISAEINVKKAEVTTPTPIITDGPTTISKLEITTPAPQVAAKDDESKVSDVILDDIYSSLRELNMTSEDVKPQVDVPKEDKTVKVIQDGDLTVTKPPEPVVDTKVLVSTVSPPTLNDKPVLEAELNIEVKASAEPSTAVSESPDADDKKESENNPSEEDLIKEFANIIATVTNESIGLIRSRDFKIDDLCSKLNTLAPLVDLPPLQYCEEIAIIDYMLNVLSAVNYIYSG
ncbi:uncharacterized protein CDAR_32051 [Caerostris darwini]|uniref:Uncharacterized protein n=1 Tax=Caerostris darwini TaxID=1538125 RepID=A0AAV4RQ69_9ARAC|nr:uncharacterized protein CDAR_32051 [Caerostris darwini]